MIHLIPHDYDFLSSVLSTHHPKKMCNWRKPIGTYCAAAVARHAVSYVHVPTHNCAVVHVPTRNCAVEQLQRQERFIIRVDHSIWKPLDMYFCGGVFWPTKTPNKYRPPPPPLLFPLPRHVHVAICTTATVKRGRFGTTTLSLLKKVLPPKCDVHI